MAIRWGALATAALATAAVLAPTAASAHDDWPRTLERPEIGRVGSHCTGTLVAPDVVLTAAHCLSHVQSVWPRRASPGPTFRIDLADGTSRTFFVRRSVVAGNAALGFRLGCANDLMLLQLDAPVPPEIARPAAIAEDGAGVGPFGVSEPALRYGYGCNAPDAPGSKGVIRETPGGSRPLLCSGDSGGPILREADGAIVGVGCSVEDDADPTRRRALIAEAIAALGAATPTPFDADWCGDGGRLFFADLDDDGDRDALCHKGADGRFHALENQSPNAFAPMTAVPAAFCANADGRLHLADLNGDRGLDFYCAAADGAATLRIGDEESAAPPWCSEGTLHLADLNGDGRADRLCREPLAGLSAVALTLDLGDDGASGLVFDGEADWRRETEFCAAADAQLHLARLSARRAAAVLLCFRPSLGSVETVDAIGRLGAAPLQKRLAAYAFCQEPEQRFALMRLSPNAQSAPFACIDTKNGGALQFRSRLRPPLALGGFPIPLDGYAPAREWPR